MAHYYRQSHPDYNDLPPYRQDCDPEEEDKMHFIYPSARSKIYLPQNGLGEIEPAIFAVAHREQDAKVYWHLDDSFLGTTEGEHTMPIITDQGEHQLVLVDEQGNRIGKSFTVL